MTSRIQYDGHVYSYFPWLIIQKGVVDTRAKADHEKVLRLLDRNLDNYIIQ
jgi:hypothetical protein